MNDHGFEDQGYEELLKETTATNANLDSLAAIAGESVEALFHVYMERVRILCEGDSTFVQKAAKYLFGNVCCLKHTIEAHFYEYYLMHEQIASIRKIPSEEEFEELIELGNNGAIDWIADHLADIVLSILTSSAKRLLEDNLSYDSIDWDFIENAAIHYFAKVWCIRDLFAYYFFWSLLDYRANRIGRTFTISKEGVNWIASSKKAVSF